MCLNSVFIKNVSASEGVINFFVTYLAGVGRERRKISDETGRGQKNFCDSNENVPDPYPPPPPHKMKNHHLARLSYHRHGCSITMYCRIYPWYSDIEEMNCAFTDHAAQFFQVSRFTLFAALAKWYPWKIHCKNICRIYGRIHVAGNRLPGHATFFFTGTHKNYLALRKASYLRQRSGISCNNVNMSTHLYPLPRSRPNQSFYTPPTHPPPPPP